MIIRPQYMNTLKTYRDVPLVKILAGIRRCGKFFFEILHNGLQSQVYCGYARKHCLF